MHWPDHYHHWYKDAFCLSTGHGPFSHLFDSILEEHAVLNDPDIEEKKVTVSMPDLLLISPVVMLLMLHLDITTYAHLQIDLDLESEGAIIALLIEMPGQRLQTLN